MYKAFGKRLLDIVLAILAILIHIPFLLAIALLIRAIMGAPVLFRQQRPGRTGIPFKFLKFRTMRDDKDGNGIFLSDASRLTPLGQFLRSTSLDELPELLIVIRGHMSLVGPRPLLMEYLDRYTTSQNRRHEVRPGITGWAQVNGRNAITWDERFKLDVWYVDHVSFWLDCRIIGMTIWKILKRDGISRPGHATMEEFMGEKI